ncbi:NAD(P)H-hydrate dehydratase [Paracoccus sp. JM45]|uniref:NAD(P)H-hydrate dehydratase n=1 Tax=Paracoccus sp. JM45 TaxID=2283626 RepID=UPI000E6CB2E5|nr:NAD(P)H-hydrate dehydratase [Paracoccus sp. JM45]RJE79747.1 NAD(P)H-hydrate dehydratase [Paracoccus sp. JM45]
MLHTVEVLTPAQMRATEDAAIASGAVTGASLMEDAGKAVADRIRLRWPVPGQATILCGPGNNGGDGYVIAHHLHRVGWKLHVLGMHTKAAGDAATFAKRWLQSGPVLPLELSNLQQGPQSDVYVDAIFGTGLPRAPSEDIAAILHHLADNVADRIVAVDCPSGLNLTSGKILARCYAAMTVAFDSPKPGHLTADGPAVCGKLVIHDLGLQAWRQIAHPCITAAGPALAGSDKLDTAWLSKRDSRGHKFTHGSAVIIAGDSGKGGAARLSARAALRVGAGLVTICPTSQAMPEHTGQPDALMRKPLDNATELTDLLKDDRIGALCIGPGCGIARAAQLLPALLLSGKPAVLDADALTALAGDPSLKTHAGCILTPHMGEFTRLFPDLSSRLSEGNTIILPEAARRAGGVVLLKGPDTVIADPLGRVHIHSAFDIPWLATAGAGDVLSGIITGLLARGQSPFDAACMGVTLHAAAARRFGPGLIADDLPEILPAIINSK